MFLMDVKKRKHYVQQFWSAIMDLQSRLIAIIYTFRAVNVHNVVFVLLNVLKVFFLCLKYNNLFTMHVQLHMMGNRISTLAL